MNAEGLLAYYERIGDAPDAIARLRRFILDLAVRGKLVPQDPKDEPASELLRRIAKEKARLVKEGKAKRQDPLPKVEPDQAPFELPVGWTWGRFPEVGMFGRGKSKHRPRNDPALFDGGEHLMIQTGDVARSQGVIKTYTGKYNDFGLSQSFKWPKGTLCITIAANIADSGILSFDACFPDSVVGFVPASMFENAKYFEYFLRTAKTRLLEFAPATAQKNINLEILTQVLIPLPPLAEQHRIVAKVDELIALCDRLGAARTEREATRDRLTAASLSRLNVPDPATFSDDARFALDTLPALTARPDQIKHLRQTILNLAVCGKIVPQDPNDEPASELLKRIVKEKERLINAGEIRKAEVVADLTSLSHGLLTPDGWAITNLQSVCNSITDGDHLPPPKAETGIPFLVIGNVRGRHIEFAGSRFVPPHYYEALDQTRRPKSGDLLYTLVGSYGIPIIVRDDQPFCVQRHIGILRPSKLIDLGFLARVMESRLVFDQATACATGIAQKTVPLSGLRKIFIPLPPLAEQRRIVAKVNQLMTLCERLEAILTTAANTRRSLLDALLAEALSPTEAHARLAAE